jgi:hypothetical protein
MNDTRDVLGDVHHGLRQEKAKGDADAIAHIYALARESGASTEELAQISSKFAKIADELVEQGEQRRRRQWLPRRRRGQMTGHVSTGPEQRQLPQRTSERPD